MNSTQHKIIVGLCLLVGMYSLSFGQNEVSQEKVSIKSIVGKAEVRSPKTGKWRPARVGMTVKMKWDVRTYVESTIELAFESGTVIKLSENSVINLSTILKKQGQSATNSKIKVSTGRIWGNVKKLVSNKSSFSFETPTAVAAIRGTRLGIQVDKNKTVVDVFEGKVGVLNKGSRKEVLVTTKKRAIVKSGDSDVEMYTFDDVKVETDSVVIDTTSADDTVLVDTTLTDTGSTEIDTLEGSLDQDSIVPELTFSITSPENNSTTDLNRITIKGTATPEATVSIGSKLVTVKENGAFAITIDLLPGVNKIVVIAQLGTVSKQEEISVEYTPKKEHFLSVVLPTDKMKIDTTIIPVKGVTVNGAEVAVDGNIVKVRPDGSFNYRVHIPDESGEYTIEIISLYNGKEIRVERTVLYSPRKTPLFLEVSTPTNGQGIKTGSIHVSGRTDPRARIEINDKRATVSKSGAFTHNIPLLERDIGEYTVRIVAINDESGEEKEKIVIVNVDIGSQLINKSIPRIALVGLHQGATKKGYITFQVFDYTVDDQLNVTVNNNGAIEQFTVDPSEQDRFALDEGKNTYIIKATDMAGNRSNVISGEMYYLPGPLSLDILEPDATQYVIDDLPPMPANTGRLYMDIEIEIDDGINNVPETILYCRVNNVNLKETIQYIYSGKIQVVRGVNNFLIEAEDKAGNIIKRSITIRISE